MSYASLEYIFATTFLKELRARKQRQTDYILSQVLPQEEYAKQQGYVQGLAEMEIYFSDLMKQVFPEIH